MPSPTNPAESVLADASRIVEIANRKEILGRRLRLALYDLGVLRLVGKDWIEAGDEHFTFGPLEHDQVRKLIGRLDEIAEARPDPVGVPGPGQLGLDFQPQPVPPTLPVTTGGLHLGGGR